MRTLQNRWYNFLVDMLSLDRSLFQIWLPAAPIAATDAALWNCENVIPPAALTFNRAIDEVARLSDLYAAVQSQVDAPSPTLAEAIGEANAKAWSAYLATQDPRPVAALPVLFQNWAARHAIGAMSAGVAFLSRAVLSTVAGASSAVGANAKEPAFAGGYADLLRLMAESRGASAAFNSAMASAHIAETWAGAGSGVVGLWENSDSAPLHRKFAGSTVKAHVVFGACALWSVVPAEWYQSSVLATAFSSTGSPPWRPNANPSWAKLFAQGGSLRRAPASLVVVDAVDVMLTSDAEFDRAEQRLIAEQAPAGLWPFYAPSSAAVSTRVSFGHADNMAIRMTTQKNHPVVLGANVLGIARYLGRAG